MIYSGLCRLPGKEKREGGMIGFFLLSNGEIVEQEGGPTGNPRDWKDIPREIDGFRVFAVSITRDAIKAIRSDFLR